MPVELSSSFDYITGGVIKSKFFSNPIWIAFIITIIITIIIAMSKSSIWWIRSVYIFTATIFVLFIYNSAILKKQSTTEEIQGAADIIGDLTYANNLEGLNIQPTVYNSYESNVKLVS